MTIPQRINVEVSRASEVTNSVNFYLDVDRGRGFEWVDFAYAPTALDLVVSARGQAETVVMSSWSPRAKALIGRAADLLGVELDTVSSVVSEQLNRKLECYENWFNDEEEDRQRLAAEEAA